MKHVGFKRLYTGKEIIEANERFLLACEQLEMENPDDRGIIDGVKVLKPYFRLNISFFLPRDKYLLTIGEAAECFVAPYRSVAGVRAHLLRTLSKFNKSVSKLDTLDTLASLANITAADPSILN